MFMKEYWAEKSKLIMEDNFYGRMPKAVRDNSTLFGVEIDSISGRIAQYLYPSAKIEISPFQDVTCTHRVIE